MLDPYQSALGHLHAALATMADKGDALAVAVIAQAVSVVERGGGRDQGRSAGLVPAANRRPC